MIANPFAGILGLLAFATVTVRGLALGFSLEFTMQTAIIGMIAFAVVGFLIGKIAERVVEESARATLIRKKPDDAEEATAGNG